MHGVAGSIGTVQRVNTMLSDIKRQFQQRKNSGQVFQTRKNFSRFFRVRLFHVPDRKRERLVVAQIAGFAASFRSQRNSDSSRYELLLASGAKFCNQRQMHRDIRAQRAARIDEQHTGLPPRRARATLTFATNQKPLLTRRTFPPLRLIMAAMRAAPTPRNTRFARRA